jgi:hypothetical protein
MTDTTNLTYEEEQQAKVKREKEKRKRQAELDEAMLIGFMAGNMASVCVYDGCGRSSSKRVIMIVISCIQQQQNHKRADTRVWVPPRNKALKEATDNFPTSCVLT